MRKPKRLTPAQLRMLESLAGYSRDTPYMPVGAHERRTADALCRRNLLDGELLAKKRIWTQNGAVTFYTRCVWLTDAGKQVLAEVTERSP